jgi:hypothetical protein
MSSNSALLPEVSTSLELLDHGIEHQSYAFSSRLSPEIPQRPHDHLRLRQREASRRYYHNHINVCRQKAKLKAHRYVYISVILTQC